MVKTTENTNTNDISAKKFMTVLNVLNIIPIAKLKLLII